MGCRQTRELSYGRMFTRRFLNLLQGRLAVMKREVCALELASLCGDERRRQLVRTRAGASATRSLAHLFIVHVCWSEDNCGSQSSRPPILYGHAVTLNSSSMPVTCSPGSTWASFWM